MKRSAAALTHANSAGLQTSAHRSAGLLQRQCSCGQHTIAGGECANCAKQEHAALRRLNAGSGTPRNVPSIVHRVLGTAGQPLPHRARRDMEMRFKHDFSDVQIHLDSFAAQSAHAVDAHAYTVGRHIVFGSGGFDLERPVGRAVLAHELAHVAQNGSGSITPDLRIDPPDSRSEAEADRAGRIAAADAQAGSSGALVSPGHRAGLLSRLSTGAGIGIAIGAIAGAAIIGGLIAALVSGNRRLMHWETKAPDAELVDDPSTLPPTSTVLLPQNTRLVIIDEGIGRPFNAGGQQWVRVRVTVGPFLNRVGWIRRGQLESRPETEEVSPEQANEIFAALSQASILTTTGSARIPFHHAPDGCYARAHRMEELLTEMGYASEKVFALAGRSPLLAPTDYARNRDNTEDAGNAVRTGPPDQIWAWHVAPIIKVRDPVRGLIETVIDPSLADGPISLAQWEDRMGGSRTFTRLSLAQLQDAMREEGGSVFGAARRHDRVAVTAPRYTYNPTDLDPDEETRADAEATDSSYRERITGYVNLIPAFELAAFIRRQLRRAVIDVVAIVSALRSATATARQNLKNQFKHLLARLKARVTPAQSSQIDSALEQ
ncbi:DUF4157 domain-containing protein [Inquilinus limosus]|uniref:eCIS core domain-containing protein n=1 Tax=Inquilinus limosus TaxID=171674 RepID=UPI003F155901